jgi:protein SCO1/2
VQGPTSQARHAWLAAILVAAVVATVVLVYAVTRQDGGESGAPAVSQAREAAFRGNRLPAGIAGRRAPALRLRNARGGTVDTRELRGAPYVVTFLYTSCPDVCPLIGQELGQALRRLGRDGGEVAVVAVSVDPRGDTPAAVRRWLERHRLPRNFHYGIGSERELKPVWKAYFVAPQAPGSEESLHTASIWLVDARGRWRTKFSGGAPAPPADIAHDLRLLLREARR